MGRKRVGAKLRMVRLTEQQTRLLRTWGRGSTSDGLRWLIEQSDIILTDTGSFSAPRKYSGPPLRLCGVCLVDRHARLLVKWGGGSMSAGLRWLVDAAAPLLRKNEPPQESGVGSGSEGS